MHADTFVYVIWAGEGVIRVYILERVSAYLYMSGSGQDRTNIYIYIYIYMYICIYIYIHACVIVLQLSSIFLWVELPYMCVVVDAC